MEIIEILKNKFSKIPFFVRIIETNNKIIIWNDKNIKIKIKKQNLPNINEIDSFVELTWKLIMNKVEKKYENFNKKLSIIIPNYNNELFIEKTIQSILNNTYQDIEIIFIDDCSTDKSLEIVKNNFSNNNRVKIYKNDENKGAYYCRNKGILLSEGYYVTFVDGDDYVEEGKFEYEINGLERLNENLENKDKYWAYGTRFIRMYVENDIENIKKFRKSNSFVFLYKRQLFNYLGLFHNNRFGADSELLKRARMYNYNFFLDENTYMYYAYTIEGKNLTQVYKTDIRREYMKERIKALKEKEYIEMALLDDDLKDFLCKIEINKINN